MRPRISAASASSWFLLGLVIAGLAIAAGVLLFYSPESSLLPRELLTPRR